MMDGSIDRSRLVVPPRATRSEEFLSGRYRSRDPEEEEVVVESMDDPALTHGDDDDCDCVGEVGEAEDGGERLGARSGLSCVACADAPIHTAARPVAINVAVSRRVCISQSPSGDGLTIDGLNIHRMPPDLM